MKHTFDNMQREYDNYDEYSYNKYEQTYEQIVEYDRWKDKNGDYDNIDDIVGILDDTQTYEGYI